MQSKKHSLLETGSNLVIGYAVAVASQMVFYHYYEIQISLNDNMAICVWMTFVSILRSYTLRRWWNRKTVKQLELMKVEVVKGMDPLEYLEKAMGIHNKNYSVKLTDAQQRLNEKLK